MDWRSCEGWSSCMGKQSDKFWVSLSPLHRYFTVQIPVQAQAVAHEMEKSTLLDKSNIHVVEKKSCIQCYIKQVRILLVCQRNYSWLHMFCCRWSVRRAPEMWPLLRGTICTDKPEQSAQTSQNNLYRQARTICTDKPEQSVQTSRNNLHRQARTICTDKPEQSVQTSRSPLAQLVTYFFTLHRVCQTFLGRSFF
jgi:hypothetical protein